MMDSRPKTLDNLAERQSRLQAQEPENPLTEADTMHRILDRQLERRALLPMNRNRPTIKRTDDLNAN